MPESASQGGGSPSSQGGFSIQPVGVLHAAGGVLHPAQGGVLHPATGGFSIQPEGFSIQPGGGGFSIQPLPVNRMTDRCKNITLAKTSFRPVITSSSGFKCPTLSVNYKTFCKEILFSATVQFHKQEKCAE